MKHRKSHQMHHEHNHNHQEHHQKHHKHEMKQLQGIQIISPPGCVPHGSEGIVGVHDGVDAVVHHHEPSASGGEDAERIKAVAHHRQMMIPGREILRNHLKLTN